MYPKSRSVGYVDTDISSDTKILRPINKESALSQESHIARENFIDLLAADLPSPTP